jgi:hypothetical protein
LSSGQDKERLRRMAANQVLIVLDTPSQGLNNSDPQREDVERERRARLPSLSRRATAVD